MVDAVPVSDSESCQICRSQGCGLGHLRSDDRRAEDICLELHQEVVSRCSAVYLELLESASGILLHGLHDVHGLECDTFQSRARYVTCGRAAADAVERALGILVPVWGAQTGERRHEVYSSIVRHALGELLNV